MQLKLEVICSFSSTLGVRLSLCRVIGTLPKFSHAWSAYLDDWPKFSLNKTSRLQFYHGIRGNLEFCVIGGGASLWPGELISHAAALTHPKRPSLLACSHRPKSTCASIAKNYVSATASWRSWKALCRMPNCLLLWSLQCSQYTVGAGGMGGRLVSLHPGAAEFLVVGRLEDAPLPALLGPRLRVDLFPECQPGVGHNSARGAPTARRRRKPSGRWQAPRSQTSWSGARDRLHHLGSVQHHSAARRKPRRARACTWTASSPVSSCLESWTMKVVWACVSVTVS